MCDIDSKEESQPISFSFSKTDEGFLLIGKTNPEVDTTIQSTSRGHQSSHKASTIDDGYKDHYLVTKEDIPALKRRALFLDPPGSKSLFAFTLHDVSLEWVFHGGLDFPSLNSRKFSRNYTPYLLLI